jgi:hypothetical protein
LAVGDGAFGENYLAAREFLVNFGEAAVVGVAQGAPQGQHVRTTRLAGQGEAAFGLGAEGLAKAPAPVVVAAADAHAQAEDGVGGGDRAGMVVVEEQGLAASRTRPQRTKADWAEEVARLLDGRYDECDN